MERAFIDFFNSLMEEKYVPYGDYSQVEYSAFKAFILHSYDLCSYLRNQRQPQDPIYETSILAMIGYIERSPKISDKVLYRGTRLPNNIFQQIIKTGKYRDDAFVSTTDNISNARQHMIMDHHEDPAATHTMVLFSITSCHKGVDISDLSSIHTIDGQEAIFKPQTIFKINEYQEVQLPYDDGTFRILYEISLVEIP